MKKELLAFVFILFHTFSYGQNLSELIVEAEEKLTNNHWDQAFNDFKSILSNYEDDLTYLQQAEVYNHLGYLNLMFLDPEGG